MSKAPNQVGTNTNTTTNVSAPPPYVQEAQTNLLNAAGNLTLPFAQEGPPDRLNAPLDPSYGTALATAMEMRQNAHGSAPLNVSDFGRYTTDAAQLGQNDISGFFNPYQQDVVNTTEQQLGEANDKQLAAIRARQGAEGAYGGNRGALEESEQRRNYGNTLASTVAGLNNTGWQNAANLGMGNAQMRQAAGIFNAQQALSAGQLQEQMNQGHFNRDLSANAQLVGLADINRQQAQRELMEPYQALDIFKGVVPGNFGGTSSGTSSQPIYGADPWQTALGIGATVGGIARASDRTLKTDIVKLGVNEDTGLDDYSWRYKGDPKTYPKVVGPMAQDVEKQYPGSTVRVGGKLAIKPAAVAMLGL